MDIIFLILFIAVALAVVISLSCGVLLVTNALRAGQLGSLSEVGSYVHQLRSEEGGNTSSGAYRVFRIAHRFGLVALALAILLVIFKGFIIG